MDELKVDYEAEYNRMCNLNAGLKKELEYVKKENQSMETEFVRMRAQLDMVYLIFGNGR